MAIPIYKSTGEILARAQVDNLHLRLHKLNDSWQNYQNNWEIPKEKKEPFTKLTGYSNSEMNEILKQINSDYDLMTETLKKDGYYTADFTLTSRSRLLAGNGDVSPLEVSMFLHFIFGFPFIPGSSLKGMVRYYAELEESGDIIKNIFGKDESDSNGDSVCGKVFFNDVIPVSFPNIETAILTPHYGEYFQHKKTPGEWYTPNPITLLVIKPGASFRFTLYSRHKEYVEKAERWLKGVLSQIGIGSKTRIGYGRFRSGNITAGGTSAESPAAAQEVKTPEYYLDKNKDLKIATETKLEAKVVKQEGKRVTVEILHPLVKEKSEFSCNSPLAPGTIVEVIITQLTKDKKISAVRLNRMVI